MQRRQQHRELVSAEATHQVFFAQLRARVIPWFADRSRALALPTITEALIAYNQGRLEGIEERLRWALATVDIINPIDLYAQGMLCLARTQRMHACRRQRPRRGRRALGSFRSAPARSPRHLLAR